MCSHCNGIRRRTLPGLLALLLALLPFAGGAESITLNLKNADIEALIKTVAEQTGKNFIVDPRVKGQVTVISSHPMEADEFYEIFLSILDVHGFAVVPAGSALKVVPDVQAKQLNVPTIVDDRREPGDQVVTQVIQVKNVAAAQLVPILRPLVPQQGHLAAYPPTNILIVSDRAGNVERLVAIISQIDLASDNDIDVVQLRHASAAEVVRIINGLQSQTPKAAGAQAPVTLAADERTNSVLITGERVERIRTRVIIEHLDTPSETGGNTQVVYLKYAKATDLLPVLTGVSESIDPQKQPGKAAAPQQPFSIQADEASNALIITAPPDAFRSLEQVIRKLDIRRAQVLVEAIIAEISLDKAKELGVQWVFDGTPGGEGPVGIIDFGGSASIGTIGATIAAGGIPAIPSGTLLGIGQFDSATLNFAALLRAISSDTAANIISTPSLLTLDNQEAEIVIGQNVPFVTGEYATTGAASTSVNPFRTISRQDVGLTLRVTPQINEGNAIRLEIEQEVSSIAPTATTGATDIVTNKRVIKTAVMVDDGHTIVLGGLIDENLQQINQKVPLLGDVPGLGLLFRSSQTTKIKRNLMVFLRPIILRDAATETEISGAKYNFLRARQLAFRQAAARLPDDFEVPVLPQRFVELPPPFDVPPEAAR